LKRQAKRLHACARIFPQRLRPVDAILPPVVAVSLPVFLVSVYIRLDGGEVAQDDDDDDDEIAYFTVR